MKIETNGVAALNATTKATGRGNLTSTDFLKLMTKQLQTQDPFAPMDANAMVAQMSQLSTNSGVAEMNVTLRGIATKLDALASRDPVPAPLTPVTTVPAKTGKE